MKKSTSNHRSGGGCNSPPVVRTRRIETQRSAGIRQLAVLVSALLWSAGCAQVDFHEPPDFGLEETLPDTAGQASDPASVAPLAATTVNAERVRYCTNSTCTKDALTLAQYNYWDAQGVTRDKQRNTVLARLSEPAVGDVEYVALLFAGQQFGSGSASQLTGQPNSWKNGWKLQTSTKAFTLISSIASKAFDPAYFPNSKTFAAVAFDAHFNYNFSASNKQEIENAYYNWLSSKFSSSKLKVIYLAGHSRGGCLALRLAKRFAAAYPNKGVIVQSFDAVCQKNQSEFGLPGPEIGIGETLVSPVNPVYYSWKTDFEAQFPNRDRLAVLHYASGDAVPWTTETVHGITHSTATETETDFGWFRQEWVNLTHSYVDAHLQTIGGAQTHLAKWLATFSLSITGPSPSVVCNGETVTFCADANANVSYQWDISRVFSPFVHGNCIDLTAPATGSGLFTIGVTATGYGFTNSTSTTLLFGKPPMPTFTAYPHSTCLGSDVNWSVEPHNYTSSYGWSFDPVGNGGTSTGLALYPSANSCLIEGAHTGTYSVGVTETNRCGTSDPNTSAIDIYPIKDCL